VLRQENEKLSAELARNHESPATDRRQLLELMRLRGQVTLLRRELSDSKRESARAAGSHAPQEAPKSDWNWPAGQFIPRANWVNAGFSKPEATIQTVLWAMATGAGDQFVNAFPPGDGGEVEPPDKLLSRMQFTTDRFFGASGATVDSLNAVGNDRADVMLHVTWADASNSNELLIVKKSEDGAWRIAGGATLISLTPFWPGLRIKARVVVIERGRCQARPCPWRIPNSLRRMPVLTGPSVRQVACGLMGPFFGPSTKQALCCQLL
jgi:hypothetical protein